MSDSESSSDQNGLGHLRQALDTLSPRLRAAADAIAERAVGRLRAGLPADVGVLVDGQTISAELLRLRSAVERNGIVFPEDADIATLLAGVDRKLREDSRKNSLAAAIATLDVLERIRHVSGDAPASLQQIQHAGVTLRAMLEEATEEDSDAVSLKLRPFAAFVSLVQGEFLSEEMLAGPIACVTESFGPQILASLMSKRLVIAAEQSVGPSGVGERTPVVALPDDAESSEDRVKHDASEGASVAGAANAESTVSKSAAGTASNATGEEDATKRRSASVDAVAAVEEGVVAAAPSDQQLCDILWKLVGEGRAALASNIANVAGGVDRIEAASLGGLFRVVALAPHVSGSVALAAHAVQPQAETVNAYRDAVDDAVLAVRDQDVPDAERLARRMLAFAASLRPALLAPQSGVTALLASLEHLEAESESFRKIRDALATFSGANLELDPMVLKGVRDHANWEGRLAAHERDCNEWLTSQRASRLRFAAATTVWREWLADGGAIGKTIRVITQGKRDTLAQAAVAESIKEWARTQRLEQLIDSTDARHRKQRANLDPIEGPARTEIHNRVESYLALLRHWTVLLRDEPGKLNNFTESAVDKLRHSVRSALPQARADVAAVGVRYQGSGFVAAARSGVSRALDDLGDLLDVASQQPQAVQSLRRTLNQEFLQDPWLQLDDQWSPASNWSTEESRQGAIDLLARLLEIASAPPDLDRAFEVACTARNHLRTAQVIDAVREAGDDARALALESRRQDHLGACRVWMRERQDETLTQIERAVCHGLLTPEQRSDMQARAITAVGEPLDFAHVGRDLSKIERELEALERGRASTVNSEYIQLLDQRRGELRQQDREVIEAAIERQDYQSAWECLEFMRQGRPLTFGMETETSAFTEFFVGDQTSGIASFVDRYAALMRSQRPRDLIEAIRETRALPPIDLSGASADEASAAARLAGAWLELKDGRGNSDRLRESLHEVLGGLGFKDVVVGDVEVDADFGCWRADVTTAPIRDRNICVVPHFGSQADGRYRVLGIHDSLNDERLEEQTRNYRDSDAVVALYFGLLSNRTRRELAAGNRKEQNRTLVVDDAVMFFACGSRTNRLARVFQCTLPFAFAEPYKTTASLVPVEMFFGRSRERTSLVDPSGANLVYGGRQLGKSALLRDIERREHDAARGRIVKWIDLKAAGVTKAEDIWAEIVHALAPLEILGKSLSRPESICVSIEDWLDDEPGRTILLLLDEADAFLFADGRKTDDRTHEGFPEVARLKGLMDKTDRRFKVVFAGLHNVQRTARDVNSPIAHLGNAVCIGPLLDDDEWKQARDLITVPLGRLGFSLNPPDLWMRVVSYTNYYPSLIQVFCKHLLEYLHRQEFDTTACPPYPVTIRDIEKAFQLEPLQEEIRHKFEMTLDLDRRYRLIALRIALACLEQVSTRYVGVDVDWVRGECLSLWHQGFPQGDQSHELFRTLLFEMVGLGILRTVGNDHYTIRSPNVLNLLGQKDKIVSDILDIAAMPPAATYFNGMSRRPLDGDVWVRSPLTADQESLLTQQKTECVVLNGSELGGIGRLRQAFTAIPGVVDVRWADRLTQAAQFQSWLEERLGSRSERAEGAELLVVPEECDWTPQWVEIAVRLTQKKTGVKRVTRIVFVAGAERVWSLTDDAIIDRLPVVRCSLSRWHHTFFDYWAEQVGLPVSASMQKLIQDATGGWPLLMEKFADQCRHSTHLWDKCLAELFSGLGTALSAEDLAALKDARRCLGILADYEPVCPSDAVDLVGEYGELMKRTLRWAERMEFTESVERGIVVEPIVREIVAAISKG